jgi:hypothetical protein
MSRFHKLPFLPCDSKTFSANKIKTKKLNLRFHLHKEKHFSRKKRLYFSELRPVPAGPMELKKMKIGFLFYSVILCSVLSVGGFSFGFLPRHVFRRSLYSSSSENDHDMDHTEFDSFFSAETESKSPVPFDLINKFEGEHTMCSTEQRSSHIYKEPSACNVLLKWKSAPQRFVFIYSD